MAFASTFLTCAGLFVGLSGAAPAATVERVDVEEAIEAIAAHPEGPPGVAVLIHRGGRNEFLRAGVADLETGAPMTPGLHTRIASMSKAYNGAVVLSLVSRGRLGLSDTIAERLPGLLPRAGQVTLRQALRHTGGLPDYIREPRFLARLMREPTRPIAPQRIPSFVRGSRLNHRPGTAFEYSDTDNIVAALMAERAGGQAYERLLRALVYRPLRLRRTGLPRVMGLPRPFLRGYEIEPGEPPFDATRSINPSLAWASGGMVSTMPEVARFFRAYVSGKLFLPKGQRSLRRAQMRFVRGDSSPPGPGRNSSGLAIFRYRTACGAVFGHTGSFPGYRLFASSSLDGRSSVVMFVNSQIVPGMGSQAVSDAIRRAQHLAVCRTLAQDA